METLCRVTINGYFIDEEGYLLTHQTRYEYGQYKFRRPPESPTPVVLTEDMMNWLPIVPSHDCRRISLVDSKEWETIARFLTVTKPCNESFRLLTIDKSKIEELTNEPHTALLYGEYFGKVHKNAVISDEGYTWVKGSRVNVSERGRRFIAKRFPLDIAEKLEIYGLERTA